MKNYKHLVLFILFLWLAIHHLCAYANYVPSPTLILNPDQAQTKCPHTCALVTSYWTGSWWTTADPISVCECLHDCPYCHNPWDYHVFGPKTP